MNRVLGYEHRIQTSGFGILGFRVKQLRETGGGKSLSRRAIREKRACRALKTAQWKMTMRVK